MSDSHILVVDDDERLRALLESFLIREGFLVTAVEAAPYAREALKFFKFDALILDIMMPGETGLELVHSLREQKETIPILLLTAMGEVDERITGLNSGADDYLTKPFEPRELSARLRSLIRRSQHSPTLRLTFGLFHFLPDKQRLYRGEEEIPITENEAFLLQSLLEAKGAPLSREDLSQEKTNEEDLRHVDVQITRLRKKIEADPKRPKHLTTVRGKGYALLS